ncbi:MAG: site-specific integrase [Sphingobacteriia bacterium]|nr:site-specific integrase [Sphingobacteriia bacterium]
MATFTILFWVKRNKIKNGKAPLYARVTVNGKRSEIAVHRDVPILQWDNTSQTLLGKTAEAKEINNHLAIIKAKLLNCQSKLEARNVTITAKTLKLEYVGVVERKRMLVEIIQQHNNDIKTLIGHDYSKATWVKYETTKKHIVEFLKWKYSTTDIELKKLNFEFITDFEFYLKSQKNIDVNTNAKYIKNVKKIIKDCVAKSWLEKDPFLAYKIKTKKTERAFLNEFELQTIQEKEFTIERLAQIRDIFIFSCYTGLAYIDLFNLTPNNISLGIDGEKWIFTNRQKTETASRIPLLPKAIEILNKYTNHPEAIVRNKLLPVPTNQKTNAYLKEIATACNIHKELTFHVARHTFATTVTLTNGVPIETVSKMLGHTKLQTTQLYAKILDKKVSGDMQILRKKLQPLQQQVEIKTGS